MNSAIRTDNKYKVVLENYGNIDYGQNPNRPLPQTKNALIMCTSLGEASKLCLDYINKYDLGSGNWGGNAGIVLDLNNKQVARISYNGRIWDIKSGNLIKK